jgi:hypothetical protein
VPQGDQSGFYGSTMLRRSSQDLVGTDRIELIEAIENHDPDFHAMPPTFLDEELATQRGGILSIVQTYEGLGTFLGPLASARPSSAACTIARLRRGRQGRPEAVSTRTGRTGYLFRAECTYAALLGAGVATDGSVPDGTRQVVAWALTVPVRGIACAA